MTRETLSLRAVDIPAIHRFGIGFDSMLDELMRVSATQPTSNYPPHNVIKTGENTVLIEVAVAGFDEGEVSITVENSELIITGSKDTVEFPNNWEYLHRGLSRRGFNQRFRLAEYVEVIDATINKGILSVYLERQVPEDKKPKNIAINYNK